MRWRSMGGIRRSTGRLAKPQALGLACARQQTPQEYFVDVAAEADFAVDFYDRHALVEPLAELWVEVDVDTFGSDAVPLE